MDSPTSPLNPRRLWADESDSDDDLNYSSWYLHTFQQQRWERGDEYDDLGRNITAQERRQEMEPWVVVKKGGRCQKAKFEDVYFESTQMLEPKKELSGQRCAPVSLVAERTEHAPPPSPPQSDWVRIRQSRSQCWIWWL